MRKYFFPYLLMALFAIGFAASDEIELPGGSDPGTPPTQESIIESAEGIIEINEGIEDWSKAFLTKYGYFCYKNDITLNEDPTEYRSITYMSANGTEYASLISTKNGNIPTQLVTTGGVVYFSFPNDTILELLYDDGSAITMLDSIAYNKKDLLNLSTGDPFVSTLTTAASLMNKNKGAVENIANTLIKKLGDVFNKASKENYYEDGELVNKVARNADGNFTFAKNIFDWYWDNVNKKIINRLNIWTGKATYKVGGSSCTLSGTIWCPSGNYNKYGTYGIICDKDPAKLNVQEAEYNDNGYQSEQDLSYSVDFRGLAPNSTYYYRAFYKFNDADHGDIVPNHGSPSDQIIYDENIKSFKTGDNVLTVEVVMCIDVTGSMSGIINTVKKNAMDFYDLFKQSCDDEGIILSGLNSQVVAFRDKNVDGSSWISTSPTYFLPDQKEEYNTFVSGLYASGGGDTPESGLEALNIAFDKSDWGIDDGFHRQVVILWTDAPFLAHTSYTDLSVSYIKEKWDAMPSGRRLILFAPNGNGYSNGGDWRELDSWKNVIHETDLESGFNNFSYILKSIIGELTGKSKAQRKPSVSTEPYFFLPNN